MKTRIAIWASLGFLVAICWVLYASARAFPITPAEPVVYALVRLTQPIALASLYFHFGVRFYWAVLANAATYALIGLMVESTRRLFRAY